MSTTTPRRPTRRRRVSTRSLGVADSYRLRIADSVRARYPKLLAAVGDHAFDAIVTAYLEAHPSQRLGRSAGEHLPEQLAGSDVHPAWYAELAQLDRARFDVAARPEAERIVRDELRDPGLPLVLIPAHALLELSTTADELWHAIDAGEPLVRPHRLGWPRMILVWRAVSGTMHRAVDADEAAALQLAADGAKLGALCESLSALRTSSPTLVIARLAQGTADAPGANPAARAVDMILRWIDDGLLARGV